MYVLGVSYPGHDISAALLRDGELICAAEEERFNREKHTRNFPKLSTEFCLKRAGIGINDVDVVTIGINPWRMWTDKYLFHTLRYFPKTLPLAIQERNYYGPYFQAGNDFRKNTGYKNKIVYINHHFSHMASSYYLSPFNESAIMSVDGLGELESTVGGYGVGNKIKKVYRKYYPHSLGLFYAAVTYYLGFKCNSGEGTVMGLAPYGDSNTYYDRFKDILRLERNGGYSLNLKYFTYPFKRDRWVSNEFVNVFGPIRQEGEELTQKHKDIAAALQRRLEDTILHIANELHRLTHTENLCMAGGVALNCVANGLVLKQTPFKKIFVQPAASDSGVAIGSALYYYYNIAQRGKGRIHSHLNNTYLGPSFSANDCVKAMMEYDLKYKKSENIAVEAAKLLAEGKILGWFKGAMEFGPRALGNRSIITAPYPAGMKDVLNSKVKHREGFRPFAPSVLSEKCSEYFDNGYESPYMLLVYNVNPDKAEKVAAITHVDGTGRVQTVTREANGTYYDLIAEFEKITGVPIILNTSFNVRGEPIVCTPQDAIRCFLKTKMDYLVLEDFLINKSENENK